jgi:hypothetical protein
VPDVFERLREAAHGDPRWSCIPYALGSEDAETSMHVVPWDAVLGPRSERLGAERYAQLREPAAQAIQVRRLTACSTS